MKSQTRLKSDFDYRVRKIGFPCLLSRNPFTQDTRYDGKNLGYVMNEWANKVTIFTFPPSESAIPILAVQSLITTWDIPLLVTRFFLFGQICMFTYDKVD